MTAATEQRCRADASLSASLACAARWRTRSRPPRPPTSRPRPDRHRAASARASARWATRGAAYVLAGRVDRARPAASTASVDPAGGEQRRRVGGHGQPPGQQHGRCVRGPATGSRCRSAASVSPTASRATPSSTRGPTCAGFEHVVRLDDVEHGARVGLGGSRIAAVQVGEAADRPGHADQQRVMGALAVLQGLGEQVERVLRLGQPAGDHAAYDEGESASPVVRWRPRTRRTHGGPPGRPRPGRRIRPRRTRRPPAASRPPTGRRPARRTAGTPGPAAAPRPSRPASSRANAVVPRSQARPTGSRCCGEESSGLTRASRRHRRSRREWSRPRPGSAATRPGCADRRRRPRPGRPGSAGCPPRPAGPAGSRPCRAGASPRPARWRSPDAVADGRAPRARRCRARTTSPSSR